jgi:hypothetical protein
MALARTPQIGELVVVERELCGYERGEVADIENVLTGERKEHIDRDLEVTEEETVEEAERLVTTSQSVDIRDESRMRAEAEQTLQNDTRFDASLNVQAQYPPYVTITADAGFQLNTSRTQTDRSTAEVARDVTNKTAKAVTDRTLQRRITRTRQERERQYRHRFEAADHDVVGVYRFVDAVWTARSVRYDPPRLQCELVIPEPAAWLTRALRDRPPVTIEGDRPTEPTNDAGDRLQAVDIKVDNWARLAADAGATGVMPPPESLVRVSRSVKSADDPPATGGSGATPALRPRAEVRDTLNVPDGYQAIGYEVSVSGLLGPPAVGPVALTLVTAFTVIVGDDNPRDITPPAAAGSPTPTLNATVNGALNGITDVLPFSIEQTLGFGFSGVVTVTCQATDEAMNRWRSSVYTRIWAAYRAAVELYDARLEEARSRAGEPPAGLRSTDARRLIETELRRLCLTMLAGGRFPRPLGVEPVTGEFAVPDMAVNAQERGRILFLEEAFDWRLIQYAPYPYYWGSQPRWARLALEDGPDAMLAAFERAGAARVVVPARDNFDLAVLFYLLTGKVWFGRRPPIPRDGAYGKLYVSIALEIGEQLNRPRNGVVLDTWRFRLPTPHQMLGLLPECPPLPRSAPRLNALDGGDDTGSEGAMEEEAEGLGA